MNAIELIENNSLTNIEVTEGQTVVFTEIALTAINMAREEGTERQAKQSPWINVNERLPEENTGVFFVVEWKDLHKGYFVGLYYGNGQWESDHWLFLPDASLGRITHWMPIPEV